jgi:tetratricopeptide (TPR) repeat protein
MSMITRTAIAAGLILGLGLALPGTSAWSFSSGGSSSSSSSASSGSSSPADDFAKAKKLVDSDRYEDAIPILEKLVAENPTDADALNELGYSHRELGHTQKALTYYLKALSTKPEHLGANEYLGELYLEMKDLPKAEERLAVLQKACTGCVEYQTLKKKVDAFKANQQS